MGANKMQIIGVILIPGIIYFISTKIEHTKVKELLFNVSIVFLIIAVIGYFYPNNVNASTIAIVISILFIVARRIFLKRYHE